MPERIVLDPKTCHGKPIIRGTRVPVARVIGYLASGMSVEDLERDYGLSAEDVRASLEYAAALVDEEQHLPLPTA
jgi:uncharacterized protein (DUF433 family)